MFHPPQVSIAAGPNLRRNDSASSVGGRDAADAIAISADGRHIQSPAVWLWRQRLQSRHECHRTS